MKSIKKSSANYSFFWREINLDWLMELIFLIIIFLIPTIFDRRLGIVFSGTKVAWLRALVIIILSFWSLKIILRKHQFIRSPLDWPVMAFLFVTTIATITSVHPYTSFVGFYGRFEGLTTWYLFGLLFFIALNYFRSEKQLKRIILCVLCAAVLMSIYGIIQRHELDPYMWGGVVTWQRVIGTIGQPNFLAAYVIMAFFLGLVLFLEKRVSSKANWLDSLPALGAFLAAQALFVIMIYSLDAQDVIVWYAGFALITALVLYFAYHYDNISPLLSELLVGGGLLLIYICLLYTQSRGGYLGFFTGAVLFALAAGRRLLFENWRKLLALGALIILISAVTMARPEFSPFARFASEITTKEEQTAEEAKARLELKGAAGSRGETWKSAFKIIADHPWFGVGPEVLKMVFPRYETELFRFKEAFHVKQDRCHNETFDVPVTKGLIAFFLYLWIIFLIFKVGWSKLEGENRLMLAGVLSAILAYIIQNQFSFGVVAITSLFWVMWAMIMNLGPRIDKEERGEKTAVISFEEIPWLAAAGIALIAAFLVYISFISFRADIYYKSGKSNLEMRQFSQAAEELKKSLAIYPFEGTTISHLGITYLNLGNVAEAIKYLNYGTLVDPFNADNFYMLGRVYISFYDRGQKDAWQESFNYAEKALKIDPYYAEVYELKGQLWERKGNLDEAWNYYRKAYEVNPTLAPVMQELIGLSRKLGRVKEAKALLEDGLQKFPDNTDIFKALEQLK